MAEQGFDRPQEGSSRGWGHWKSFFFRLSLFTSFERVQTSVSFPFYQMCPFFPLTLFLTTCPKSRTVSGLGMDRVASHFPCFFQPQLEGLVSMFRLFYSSREYFPVRSSCFSPVLVILCLFFPLLIKPPVRT